MDNKLIPLYRERESYTFFYEQQNNVLYKLQHRNKSFGLFFIFILGMTWASELISDIYANYQSSFLNIIIFISAIGITYYLTDKFYHAYYNKETKREIILDKIKLQEYAVKGLKQLRIEFYSSIVSLPISILFFIIFFSTSEIRPLIIGCIFLGVVLILAFMKPLSRKKLLKKFEDKMIEL